MEEQNDMNSPLLTETSTSKLTAKQPLTKKKHWNIPQKIQRQRRSHETVRGCNGDKIKSHTCQVGDPQTRKHTTGVKLLSPTSGSPAWVSGIGRNSLQRIWFWQLAGFDHRNYTILGEQTALLEGTHRVLIHSRTQGKCSDLIRDCARPNH